MYMPGISVVDSHPAAVIPGDYLPPKKLHLFAWQFSPVLTHLFYNQSYGLNM